MICVGTLSFAQPQSEIIMHDTTPIVQRDTYKTEDILLLFKSCYETIYFLGNTKYKRSKKELKEEVNIKIAKRTLNNIAIDSHLIQLSHQHLYYH